MSMLYCEPSRYCDSDHESIRELASRLTRDAVEDAEKAESLFYWVRDRIPYRLGLYSDRASETLASGRGSCSNKANLLVALARAAGIPAGFHLMQVKTKEYFGPLCDEVFHPFLSERSLHVYCALRIDGRWVKCDPSDDSELSSSTEHLNPQSRKVEFDGTRDAMLNIDPAHVITEDAVCYPDIDGVFAKTRRCAPVFLTLVNHYLDFMRYNGRRFATARDLTLAFLREIEELFPAGSELLRGNVTLPVEAQAR